MDYDEELDEDYSPENDHNYDEEDDDEDLEFQLEEDEPELPHDIDINDIINQTNTQGTTSSAWSLLAALMARRRVIGPDDDDDDDGDTFTYWPTRARTRGSFRFTPPAEPQPEGLALLRSGEFGEIPESLKAATKERQKARKDLGLPRLERITQGHVPNSIGTVVASYGTNVYAGQFSTDSSFYYTCVQGFRLYIYDTKAPIQPRKPNIQVDHRTTMKLSKQIRAHSGGWTITDSHLSPDNRHLAYAIRSSTIYLASTVEGEMEQRALHFGNRGADRGLSVWGDPYGIWSCRFSADGNVRYVQIPVNGGDMTNTTTEIVAGGTSKIFVYDLIANRRSVMIDAHSDDVNSCCWADANTNILISGSDDTFIKVWDRRSLGSSGRPSGVLVGHTEGITYVAPKGDGRYVISNGKDQGLRLWDLRKMVSYKSWSRDCTRDYGIPGYDYRSDYYPEPKYTKHPNDCSVMVYRGHSVMRTLIRCNFSPAETTGSKYIYSGSSDGIVHIWSLDGTVVEKLDRRKVQGLAHHPSDPEELQRPTIPYMYNGNDVVVRDVAWHPSEPVLMTCSWGSPSRSVSEVARHEWKGLNKLGGRLEDFGEKKRQEEREIRALSRDDDY